MVAVLRRIVQWRVSAKYYIFAVGFMVAIKLAAAIIYRASSGSWPRFDTSHWYLIPVTVALFDAVSGRRGNRLARLCPAGDLEDVTGLTNSLENGAPEYV